MTIYEQTTALGEAITETEEYKRFKEAEKAQQESQEATDQINDYNKLRNELALQIRNTNPPKEEIDKIRETLDKEFEKLRENPIIDEYIEANKAFTQLVENINNIIGMYVSGNQGGCGGSCSSCSGCH